MSSGIYSVTAFIFFVISIAWVGLTSRYFRALAKNHPTSFLASVFETFDKLVERVIFRDVIVTASPGQAATGIGPPVADTPHEHSIPAVQDRKSPFSVVHALYVCVAPKSKIPNGALVAVNPTIHLLVFGGLWSTAMFLAFAALSDSLPPEILAPIWGTILMGGFSWYLYSLLLRDKGYTGLPAKLAMNPELNIFLTKNGLYLFSAWGQRAMRTKGVRFFANEGPMITELTMQRPGQDRPAIIFAYPSFFSRYLLPEERISAVCFRLNQLILFSESMHDFDFESLDTPRETIQ
jgi:hypothetical protein